MPTSGPGGYLVLGGGIAGIAAAVELARLGARPTLIESRPYLGGRLRSFLHEGSGDEVDNGQHLMMGCYHETFRLLERLGTRDLVTVEPSLRVEFRDADGRSDLLSAPRWLPSPLGSLVGIMRLGSLGLGDRLSVLRLGLAVKFGRVKDDETVREYLTRLGQSSRLQERLWDPIVIATMNTPPQVASARLFVEVMRRAFLGSGSASHLAFPRAGLSHLVAPAEEYIESRGGRCLIGSAIASLERSGDAWRVGLKDGSTLTSSRVISALPPRALRSILADTELHPSILPPAPTYSPIVSLYLWYDRDLSDLPMFCALIGTQVQWVFNRRLIDRHAEHGAHLGLLSCTISAAFEEAATDAASVIATADRELRRALPELQDAQLIDALVLKEKQATFRATPEFERLRPHARTTLPGLFLAGDWTATGLPATIEGAVWSGVESAGEAVAF